MRNDLETFRTDKTLYGLYNVRHFMYGGQMYNSDIDSVEFVDTTPVLMNELKHWNFSTTTMILADTPQFQRLKKLADMANLPLIGTKYCFLDGYGKLMDENVWMIEMNKSKEERDPLKTKITHVQYIVAPINDLACNICKFSNKNFTEKQYVEFIYSTFRKQAAPSGIVGLYDTWINNIERHSA